MPKDLSPDASVDEVEAGSRPIEGVGTTVAAFVGFAAAGPFNQPTLVLNWRQFTNTFGDFVEGASLAHAVYGYFANGGGVAYIVRVGQDGIGGSGSKPDQPALSGPRTMAVLGGYRVTELDAGDAKTDLSIEIEPPSLTEGETALPGDLFKLVVKRGRKVEETFDRVSTSHGKDNVVTTVTERSKLIKIEETGSTPAPAKPQVGSVALAPPPAVPARISIDGYVGEVDARTGLSGLTAVEEVTMVAVPDLMCAYQRGAIGLEEVQAVQKEIIAHCELMGDRVAILDAPPGLGPSQVKKWLREETNYDSSYASLYYPWISVSDPVSSNSQFVPPSGHVAGVWARNDDARGVHRAPADEVVRGAAGVQVQLTTVEHDLLNLIGINCIRAFPGRGIQMRGTRTLNVSDPGFTLNARRLVNYMKKSILNGTRWLAFEPNDDALCARTRHAISAFLLNEWHKGALSGLTPDEAFYVKCDRKTNSAGSVGVGQVVTVIGVAPVKPAEFVIFRLTQSSNGTSLISE